jgi:PAS domain S-box-containing protein
MPIDLSSPTPSNVLLVDDNEANLIALSAVLEQLGQNLITARSGEEALRLVLDHDFAVILLDMRMPGMDGLETAAAIKQRSKSRHTPIIFLTAESGEAPRAKGYAFGAVDYLTKPYDPEIVRSKVAVFVELYHRGERIKAQEERLRILAQERLRFVVTHAPIILFALDAQGVFTLSEGSELTVLGIAAGEHVGKSVFDLYADEPELIENARRALRGEQLMSVGYLRRFDMFFETQWIPVKQGGKVTGVIGLATNVTARRRAEEERAAAVARELQAQVEHVTKLKQIEAELQAAVRVRDDFLSIASHELNTPLTPLKMQLGALQRRAWSPKEGPRRLQVIERQVDRMTRLVAQLLDVSRISGGRLELSPERVEILSLVLAAATNFGPDLQRTGSKLLLDLGGPILGYWDPIRIEQVVANLLSNAIKYGRGNPITIRVRREESTVRLTVIDEGIGIAPEQQGLIFERFERAVSVRHYGGFGIGLWIVRQVVQSCGGTISVESSLGAGSRFDVLLPLHEEEPPQPDVAPRHT